MDWLLHLQHGPGARASGQLVELASDLATGPLEPAAVVAGVAILCTRYSDDPRIAFVCTDGAAPDELITAELGEPYTRQTVVAAIDRGPAGDAPGPALHVAIAAAAQPPARPQRPADLWLDFAPTAAGGWRLTARFDPAIYRRDRAAQLVANLAVVFRELAARPGDAPLHQIAIVADDQRGQLETWAHGPRDGAGFIGLVARFEQIAAASPDAVALRALDEPALSYAELDRRANAVAHHLARAGVTPGARVMVCLPRTTSLVVGLLGVLKAGACYVAIEPGYPSARVELILADTAAAVVLTDGELPAAAGARTLRIDRSWFDEPVDPAPRPAISGDATAYILYTSGSTGTPKGVVVGHDNLDHFLRWSRQVTAIGPGDTAVATTSILFDVSVCDLFTPLIAGATLVLLRKPTDLLALRGVDAIALMCAVPSAFHTSLGLKRLLGPSSGVPAIRVLNLAGEALDEALARAILDHVRPGSLRNCYGPTEATVYATWAEVRDPAAITIGRPLPDMQAFVIDRHGNLMPPGLPGELALGGAGVARGYLDRDDLTRQRFVHPAFDPERRLYRTGDRVRVDDDGALHFLGRLDNQIKLHGYRIELGEVEAAIASRTSVTGCAVFPVSLGRRGTVLVGCYCGGDEPAAIVRDLAPFLTNYMIPTEWIRLEQLPHTASGKLDRVALRAVAEARLRGAVQPRSTPATAGTEPT